MNKNWNFQCKNTLRQLPNVNNTGIHLHYLYATHTHTHTLTHNSHIYIQVLLPSELQQSSNIAAVRAALQSLHEYSLSANQQTYYTSDTKNILRIKREWHLIASYSLVRYAHHKNTTRNSSGDEIANVNFLYDDMVHVLQNTIDSCIISTTARRGGYVLERTFTKFSEITQCNGHYAVQGHSRSPSLVPIESPYATSY